MIGRIGRGLHMLSIPFSEFEGHVFGPSGIGGSGNGSSVAAADRTVLG